MICLFSRVEILEESKTGNGVVKEFFNVSLQVDQDGFFVANGKWKVPWRKVTTFSTNDTMIHLSTIVPAATEQEDEDTHDNDNDRKKKKKKKKGLQVQAFVDDSDDDLFPPPLEQWPHFQKYAQKKWNKILAKKDRRASVLRQEAQEEALAVRRANSKPKRSRAERFFWKNLTNLKTLGEDESDDETFNRRHHKVLLAERNQKELAAETTNTAQNSSDDEEGEATTLQDTNQEQVPPDTPTDQKEEEEDSSPVKTTTRHKKHGKLRIKKRKVRRDDSSSDEDEDIFGTRHHKPTVTTTTPMSRKNVVTPGASLKKTTTTALLEDDDDDDEDDLIKEDSEKQTLKQDDIQNVAPITSYFTSFKKKSTTSTTTSAPPAANNKKETENNVQSPVMMKHTTVQKKKAAAPSDFFAPRSSTTKVAVKAAAVESDEETVVPPAPQTPPRQFHHPKEEPAPRTPPRSAYKHLYQSVTESDNDEDHTLEYVNPRHLSPIRHNMASPLAERMSGGGTARKHNKRQHYFGTKAPPSRASAVLALDQADQSPARRNLYQGLDLVSGSSPNSRRNQQPRLSSPPRKRSRILATTPRSPSSSRVLHSKKYSSPSPLEAAAAVPTSKFRGLRNLGNTCYINSSLQMLFSIPEFSQALAPLAATQGRTRLVQSFCETFQDVIHHPSSSEEGNQSEAASAKQLKLAVDKTTDQFRGYQQRDAHEFLGHLIDEVHEELEHKKKTNKDHEDGSEDDQEAQSSSAHLDGMTILPTDDYFRLNVEVNLKCKSCGYSRSKEEMYRYLSLDIIGESRHDTTSPPRPTVERCLDLFFQPEDRDIKCEKCKDGTQATQTMRILSRPRALLLHLKRFKMVEHRTKGDDGKDEVSYSFQKNKAAVELNDKVSLDRFLSDKATASVLSSDYSLRSIVHHIGTTANSGHYTADALREETSNDGKASTQQWVSYDDSTSTETTLGEIQKSLPNRKTAYMLLYSTD